MDKDFHYYGTFTAARLAGFSVEEATTIAHSAQYVDDSTRCSGRIMSKGEKGLPFQPQPTCHDAVKELGWNLVKNPWNVPDKEVHRVWMSFHFLPGNYRSTRMPDPNWQSRMREYSGPQSWGGIFWRYDDHAKAQFQLLCLPRSPLAAKMVNQSWLSQIRPSYWLHILGIRMHAYADTGAHMYYAGTPAWHVNDAHRDVYDRTVVPESLISWVYGDWMAYKLGVEACTPPWVTFDSIFYLGHGRMGHVPDYPWMRYYYQPMWSSQNMTKDNPAEYMRTFLEMILALQYQRGDRSWIDFSSIDQDIDHLRHSISGFLPAISDILGANPGAANDYDDAVNKRCDLWRRELANGGRLASLGKPSREYDPDAWVNIARQSNEIQSTDYYKFNIAANEHANFVREHLLADGITLADWNPL